jgi:hypothetical protein
MGRIIESSKNARFETGYFVVGEQGVGGTWDPDSARRRMDARSGL